MVTGWHETVIDRLFRQTSVFTPQVVGTVLLTSEHLSFDTKGTIITLSDF